MSGLVSLPDLISAIRGQIPKDKCDLLEELVQRLQNREIHLNRRAPRRRARARPR
jgi:CBS domain containing-hemolysin-like protein